MRRIGIEELESLAAEAREEVWENAREERREPKIYLHWTAGHYDWKPEEPEYHICIDGKGTMYLAADLSETLAHTWKRNSGSVGISLCCAYLAKTNDLGDEPPTSEQIEVMAQATAAVANGLWLTIDKEHVLTHGEAADNEDSVRTHAQYGPRTTCERWDLEFLGTSESPSFNPWASDGTRGGDVLRGKANWYRTQWNA